MTNNPYDIKNNLSLQINKYADRCITNSCIDPDLYDKYNVKRGLREKAAQVF